ncbi:MAG: GFA family protein [Burkholderiales bacterium]|nr:GFA family protein [Burkholderiales bacterium]
MRIDGACLCGHVRYEALIDPARVGICHCRDCQISSATAFRVGAPVPVDDFKLLSGSLRVYVKTAESGSRRALSFCPECGTSIHGSAVENATTLSLRIGTARQFAQLVPQQQIWCRSALPWLGDLIDTPRYLLQTRESRIPDSP